MRNSFARQAAALLAFTAGVAGLGNARQQNPNIVFILTDDMGYGDVTCNGPGIGIPTPNIDRIAKQGIRFTQYYVAAPVCSPSRAALLTGQFPGQVQITTFLQQREGNRNAEQNDFLDPSKAVIPRVFKEAGYVTGHFGKWHLGGGRDVNNAPSIGKYGYDEWSSTWESPEPDPKLGVKFAPWDKRMEPGQVVRDRRTEYWVTRTLGFMQKHKGKPVFVNLWPDDVHTPFRPSAQMMKKHNGKPDQDNSMENLRGVLEEYDRQMGRLLDGISSMGLAEDTLVIFTSDNGPSPVMDQIRTNGMRGMKLSLYEGGTRMPFLAMWPGKIKPGMVDEKTLMSGVDMAKTLCSLAGISPRVESIKAVDGEDMSKAFFGNPVQRTRSLLWEYGRNGKLGHPKGRNQSPRLAIREGDLKLLLNEDGSSAQMYNIPADVNETKNIMQANTARADQMSSRVLEWRKKLPPRNQP